MGWCKWYHFSLIISKVSFALFPVVICGSQIAGQMFSESACVIIIKIEFQWLPRMLFIITKQNGKVKSRSASFFFFFIFWFCISPRKATEPILLANFPIASAGPFFFFSVCPQMRVFYQDNIFPSPLIFIQPSFFSCLNPWKDAVVVTEHQGNAKTRLTRKATTTTRQCFVLSLVAVRQTPLEWRTWANTSLKQSLRMSRSVSVVLRCRKVQFNAPV